MTMHQMSFADLKAAEDICRRISKAHYMIPEGVPGFDDEKGLMWANRAAILYDEMMDRLDTLFKTKT